MNEAKSGYEATRQMQLRRFAHKFAWVACPYRSFSSPVSSSHVIFGATVMDRIITSDASLEVVATDHLSERSGLSEMGSWNVEPRLFTCLDWGVSFSSFICSSVAQCLLFCNMRRSIVGDGRRYTLLEWVCFLVEGIKRCNRGILLCKMGFRLHQDAHCLTSQDWVHSSCERNCHVKNYSRSTYSQRRLRK